MYFEYPYLLWLLVLPVLLLALYLYRELKERDPHLRVSTVTPWEAGGKSVLGIVRHLPEALRLIALCLLILCIARPRSKSEMERVDTEGIDIMDSKRGLDLKKRPDLYANCGWFFFKFIPYVSDLNNNSTKQTQENKVIMRYAEVLLLYAEACAMTGDSDGLQYLNKVAERAGAPTYSALTMENVKKEKWFEMAWEGTRFVDLVRWGDAEKELAFRSHSKTPYLRDDFYGNWKMTADGNKDAANPLSPVQVTDEAGLTYWTLPEERAKIFGSPDEVTGRPHKAIVVWEDDGYGAKGGGFQKGKHELYPFPFDVVTANPWNESTGTGIKQNPGWE